jgi:hypothetical protein
MAGSGAAEWVIDGVDGVGQVRVGVASLLLAASAWFPDERVLIVNSGMPVLEQLVAVGRWAEALSVAQRSAPPRPVS